MSFKIGEIYGLIADKMLHFYFPSATEHPETIEKNPELFWKLCVARLVINSRCVIPSDSGRELFVYDQILNGMSSWKDYYFFLETMIN